MVQVSGPIVAFAVVHSSTAATAASPVAAMPSTFAATRTTPSGSVAAHLKLPAWCQLLQKGSSLQRAPETRGSGHKMFLCAVVRAPEA